MDLIRIVQAVSVRICFCWIGFVSVQLNEVGQSVRVGILVAVQKPVSVAVFFQRISGEGEQFNSIA